MARDLFNTINVLWTSPNYYYISSNLSTQYYIQDWIDIGYQSALKWSTALSLAALDFINAGKDNGFYTPSATAENIFTKALCNSYDIVITHTKNSATDWTSVAPLAVINEYIELEYFDAY